jgi:hypothetical protein
METLASAAFAALEQISEDKRPEELELACGLKAAGSGFAVAALAAEANFQLRLLWRKRSDPLGGGAEGMDLPEL